MRISLLRAGWLILPVVAAGLGHVAVLKTNGLRRLAIPVDRGARWHGRPVFGANKTWRGIVLMTGLGALATGLQSEVERRNAWIASHITTRPAPLNPWLAGAVSGLAYCLAELPNSFFKRRLGIPPGARGRSAGRLQYVIDQTDSVIGGLIALRLLYRPPRDELAAAVGLGVAVHIGIDQMLYVIGVKRRQGR
jgi:hypothetical protein